LYNPISDPMIGKVVNVDAVALRAINITNNGIHMAYSENTSPPSLVRSKIKIPIPKRIDVKQIEIVSFLANSFPVSWPNALPRIEQK
jgi:hypothetical protein